MSFSHKQKEQVRAYLLGTMSGPKARAFEERYFEDRAFFLWVQAVEVALIEDYLNGKLSPENTQNFEGRYLQASPLQARLEEVRQKQGQQVAVRRLPTFRWAPLGVLALLCSAAGLYWVLRHSKVGPHQAVQEAVTSPSPVRVHLLPGVQQGGTSIMAEIPIPRAPSPIEFDLEVPGRIAPFRATVAISEIDAEGGLHRVWASPSQISSSPEKNQEVVFQVDSSLLHHGDYRLDLDMSDGSGGSTYIFRVVSPSFQPERQLPRHE
jgi:hypothetical protein